MLLFDIIDDISLYLLLLCMYLIIEYNRVLHIFFRPTLLAQVPPLLICKCDIFILVRPKNNASDSRYHNNAFIP